MKGKQTLDLETVRSAVANHKAQEGCECCNGSDYSETESALASLLLVERYDDDSGWNFSMYETENK